ncbi:hypothetical protein [Croceicoccus mobilis]|uniref:Uncharacterized protein n=1 Tax=Croceicoccus mobilis TaxID=1703339 RepID=A0A916YUC3_9SPHN|nr:hypothetical protein [Croceicoccus mobilis]GGD61780.1 hypothetical protein GCM10010990_09060 [Croceicoccus mobilis]
MADRISLRAAINAHCKSCSYDKEEPGGWRQQVQDCGVPRCALYAVRPVPKVSEG